MFKRNSFVVRIIVRPTTDTKYKFKVQGYPSQAELEHK